MPRDHAVVLGAGMAGLLAARALSDFYAQVTVVERDRLTVSPQEEPARRGVPQGHQINGLESRGVQVLEGLLPGLIDELSGAGATLIDDLGSMHYRVDELLMTRRPTSIHPFLLVTRPFLEAAVRRRVCARPGVTIRDRQEVAGLLSRSGGGDPAVTGVRLSEPGGGAVEDVPADLVVDAAGRGSRAPVWLDELGYHRPAEQRIPVKITYATRVLHFHPEPPELPPFVIEGTAKAGRASISMFRCERGRTLFSVNGPRGAFPSVVTGEWMLQVAEERMEPETLELVRAASRAHDASPVAVHQVPASVWRRYDQLNRFPPGLLVLGDALCAFNPVYGQGVSVAGSQVLALREALHANCDPAELAGRFFPAASRPTAAAWRLASGPDLARTGGGQTRERAAAWVTGKLLSQSFRAAQRDTEVARTLTGVTGLSEQCRKLLRPRVLAPVAVSAAGLAGRRLIAACRS